jgi:hypothetical protein
VLGYLVAVPRGGTRFCVLRTWWRRAVGARLAVARQPQLGALGTEFFSSLLVSGI